MINFEATVYAGDTIRLAIPGLGSLTGVQKIYFSVKRYRYEADNRSIVHIELTDGLLYFNASEAKDKLHGGITITDENDGDISVFLQASESVQIFGATYYCDVKVVEGDGSVITKMQGELTFEYTITKAVT